MGPLQLIDHVVQNVMLGRKQRTGTRQTKDITILNDASSLFVLLCGPVWRFVPRDRAAANGPLYFQDLTEIVSA